MECRHAQTNADIAASGMLRFVIRDRMRSTRPMSNVSMGGQTITIRTINSRGEPSNAGPVSSVTTPQIPRTKTTASDGRRLISPVRSTYRRIEMRVSNSHRSSHICGLTGSDVSVVPFVSAVFCSGSNGQLRKCLVRYSIRRINAIFKTAVPPRGAVSLPSGFRSWGAAAGGTEFMSC